MDYCPLCEGPMVASMIQAINREDGTLPAWKCRFCGHTIPEAGAYKILGEPPVQCDCPFCCPPPEVDYQ